MSFANKRGRGRGYDGRGSDGRGGGNQSYSATRRTEINRNQRAPIILAKPQHHDHRSGRDPVDVDYSDRPPNRVGPTQNDRKQVLTRKESSQGEDPRQVESPRPPSSTGPGENSKPQHQREVVNNPNDYIPPRNIKLVDDNQFCEHFCDYLNENSTDFIIVGVIGTTSVGKSSILNALINPRNNPASLIQKPLNENGQQQTNGNGSTTSQRMFRVQTFEKQMLSEHCTNGVNAWIDASRIAYLDSQPLFSNSVLDRSAQLEKKYSFEFSGAENTSEVHSLQLIAYFMSICHVVLVVQEGALCDTDLIEKIKVSELLRPSVMASRSVEESDKLVEYSPEIVFIHNKVSSVDFNPQTYSQLRADYEELFKESGFNFRCRTNLSSDDMIDAINIVLLPDLNEPDVPNAEFSRCILKLRRTLSTQLQIRPLLSDVKKGQNEKLWFLHAKKMWDQIKTSNFYLEYSRLLRQRT